MRTQNFRLGIVFTLLMSIGVSSLAWAAPIGEVNPNESKSDAVPLARGQTGVGEISSGPDFDFWRIPNVLFGDKFYIMHSAEPQPPSALDPVMIIKDQSHIDEVTTPDSYLIYNDDGGPAAQAFDDSLAVGEKVKRNGSLFVRAEGFGSSTGTYELFQLVAGPNEFLPESEPNDTPQTASPITAPVMTANGSADADYFSFHAVAGEKLVVMVDNDPIDRNDKTSDAVPVNILFQSEIDVFAPDGVTNISDVPNYTAENEATLGNAAGVIPITITGTHYVRIQKLGTFDNPYHLVVLVDGDTPISGACCSNSGCQIRTINNCAGFFSGVGTNCQGDDDGDGLVNACDNCTATANAAQEDNDGDNFGNACDACSEDGAKLSAGACGCGTSDIDSDGDGVPNCNDQCSSDANKVFSGACGCGVADLDSNKNGAVDCQPGPEVKALLKSIVKQLKGLDAGNKAKVAALKKLLKSVQSTVQSGGAQIAITKAGFNLGASVKGLAKAVNAALKASNAANKSKAQKAAQKIIAAIA